jgi:hypothetical protein
MMVGILTYLHCLHLAWDHMVCLEGIDDKTFAQIKLVPNLQVWDTDNPRVRIKVHEIAQKGNNVNFDCHI